MAFGNFSVLAVGSLLMGIPILLHLMMKKRPRHQIFPAIRFLHRRQVSNKRQMQLRNWLLLLLRLAAIGLLAALFARPSVDSAGLGNWLKAMFLAVFAPFAMFTFIYCWLQKKGKLLVGGFGFASLVLSSALAYFGYLTVTTGHNSGIGDAQTPVAAALVFDTSPRMGLKHQNLTRLDEARALAQELMKQLPPESEVAVVDAAGAGTFSVDIGAAVNMVESLQVNGSEYPLHELVLRGLELVQDRNGKRKEIYVLTELSQEVWRETAFNTVKSWLAEKNDVSLFVLDVGVANPRNVQIGPLRLSSDSLAKGQPLRIETDVECIHSEDEVLVTLSLEQPDPTRPVIVDGEVILPELTQRDRVKLKLNATSAVPVEFELRALSPGVHHGQIRVDAEDGLPVDNTRYFTIEVRSAWTALLATGPGAEYKYVEAVISPFELRQRGEGAFDRHVIQADQLLDQELSDFAVVTLFDPGPLTPEHWQRLAEYVRLGGGLAVFLGRNAISNGIDSFNQATATVLPGQLEMPSTNDEAVFIAPDNTSHPMLAFFRGRETVMGWDASPVMRYWIFRELKPGTNIITRFSNNQPAIVESLLGSGRVVTMTTPVSDVRNNKNRPAWNYFPTSEDQVPFFLLIYGMFPYLADQSQPDLNHSVEEVVTLPTSANTTRAETWQLFTPQLDWQNVRSENGSVTVAATSWPGTYRLKNVNQPRLGFSTNLPTSATDLTRLNPKLLHDVLGTDRFNLARGTKELNRGIGRSRIGRELFPFLVLIVVGLLAMEHLMSNRFYGNEKVQPLKQELRTAA